MATVKKNPNFNAEKSAEALNKAMKGFGTDEKALVRELQSINNAQRQEVKVAFKTIYGKDLVDTLKSELGGSFEDVVVALMRPAADYDAWCLRQAMKGAGTDEGVLVDILCTRSNAEIQAIKASYHALYDRDLEKDVVSETSGHLKRVFVSLLQGHRKEGHGDPAKAKADAQALLEAGEKSFGTDESEFQRVFTVSSPDHLRMVCAEYRAISQYDLERVIEKEMSGALKDAFVALVECARDPNYFYARRLDKAMAGMGTNDADLIRLIVSNTEKNMEGIKMAFMNLKGHSLSKAIDSECGGDYKRILLNLID